VREVEVKIGDEGTVRIPLVPDDKPVAAGVVANDNDDWSA
jgi:hypothetical protein